MSRILKIVAIALVMVLLSGGGLYWRLRVYLQTPYGGDTSTTVQITRGTTLKPLLDDLQARAVLDRPRWLYYWARFNDTTEIKTGEYEVKATQTPLDILGMFLEGKVKLESFTIAEGLNRWQVRDQLVGDHWLSRETFEGLCDDQKFLNDHGIPGPTCDGYLFPETYTFARGVDPSKIFAELFKTFLRVFDEVSRGSKGPLDLSTRELTTLASIVEKETGASEERPHIACLFYNRLRVTKPKWRLDTDPTVIYAATMRDPNFNGKLTLWHLHEMEHPYNTYKIYGLPPGPICNPGRAALEAVFRPSACDEFFFVSMNNGHHEFCKTLDCHNKAVERWQKRHETPPR